MGHGLGLAIGHGDSDSENLKNIKDDLLIEEHFYARPSSSEVNESIPFNGDGNFENH